MTDAGGKLRYTGPLVIGTVRKNLLEYWITDLIYSCRCFKLCARALECLSNATAVVLLYENFTKCTIFNLNLQGVTTENEGRGQLCNGNTNSVRVSHTRPFVEASQILMLRRKQKTWEGKE